MSKIGTAFKLLIAPKKALAFCREKMVKDPRKSIPLVTPALKINKLYPVHSAKSILIVSTSFGVGVIQLSLEDPHSSEVIFPAKFRETYRITNINNTGLTYDNGETPVSSNK